MTGLCLVRVFHQDSCGVVIEIVSEPRVEDGVPRRRWRGQTAEDALTVVERFFRESGVAGTTPDGASVS